VKQPTRTQEKRNTKKEAVLRHSLRTPSPVARSLLDKYSCQRFCVNSLRQAHVGLHIADRQQRPPSCRHAGSRMRAAAVAAATLCALFRPPLVEAQAHWHTETVCQ
jgi:hypothetical protein